MGRTVYLMGRINILGGQLKYRINQKNSIRDYSHNIILLFYMRQYFFVIMVKTYTSGLTSYIINTQKNKDMSNILKNSTITTQKITNFILIYRFLSISEIKQYRFACFDTMYKKC